MKHTSLSVFLTGRCNLNCSYCFIDKENLKRQTPDIAKIKKGIDLFLDVASEDPTINFTGGEPMLLWKALKNLIQHLRKKKRKIFIVVLTNGTILNQKKYYFFKKNNIDLSISLDGKKETNDLYRVFKDKKDSVFETVWNNIKNLDRERIKLSSVFTPKTVNHLAQNIKFFIKNGFRQFDFYPEIYGLWSDTQFKRLEKTFNKLALYGRTGLPHFDLGAPSSHIKISFINRMLHKNTENFCCQKLNLGPDGNFYLCDKVFSFFDKRRKKYMVGNGQKGIDEQKREKMLGEAKKEILKETQNKCLKCSWQNYCFCPIGLYLWCKENQKDFKKHFQTFCEISRTYISGFLKIKDKNEKNKKEGSL